MKVALAVLLFLVGVMILMDTVLRAFVHGVQVDQVPTLASGILCLIGGSYFWRSRRPSGGQTTLPAGSAAPPADPKIPTQATPPGELGSSAAGGEARAALRDPFAAYNAGSNVEAHLVCGLLRDAAIEAVVVEDVSQAGVWLGGTVAEIHKPQVWIERADIERARVILTDYERRNAERRAAGTGARASGPPVGAVCEECSKQAEFPAAQRGTVQSCPHCGAYIDVGDEVGFQGWDEASGEDEA